MAISDSGPEGPAIEAEKLLDAIMAGQADVLDGVALDDDSDERSDASESAVLLSRPGGAEGLVRVLVDALEALKDTGHPMPGIAVAAPFVEPQWSENLVWLALMLMPRDVVFAAELGRVSRGLSIDESVWSAVRGQANSGTRRKAWLAARSRALPELHALQKIDAQLADLDAQRAALQQERERAVQAVEASEEMLRASVFLMLLDRLSRLAAVVSAGGGFIMLGDAVHVHKDRRLLLRKLAAVRGNRAFWDGVVDYIRDADLPVDAELGEDEDASDDWLDEEALAADPAALLVRLGLSREKAEQLLEIFAGSDSSDLGDEARARLRREKLAAIFRTGRV
jgi:hypothetical protein